MQIDDHYVKPTFHWFGKPSPLVSQTVIYGPLKEHNTDPESKLSSMARPKVSQNKRSDTCTWYHIPLLDSRYSLFLKQQHKQQVNSNNPSL